MKIADDVTTHCPSIRSTEPAVPMVDLAELQRGTATEIDLLNGEIVRLAGCTGWRLRSTRCGSASSDASPRRGRHPAP